jgi:sulfite reductase (NADPH) hemoprotein beta-component
MYIYDHYDQQIVDERVAQFRDQTSRFLSGELAEDDYRILRLMNGIYIQTHGPMMRIAIPYGMLNSKQLRMLAHIARQYDKGFGHITTRTNIQYNWVQLADTPDILADLASVQMHAIQTSGNCIRNTTADPLAGVAADELEDPRPYCEIIRQWSTLHPEFSYLPRKFKISVSGAATDRAAIQVNDIGLQIVHNDAGELGFEVLVGGGLGRTPVIGQTICEFLPEQQLLSYLEAILRVYNTQGRRDNLYKARIKILVQTLGIDKFRELVETEWQAILENSPVDLTLDQAEINRIKAHFQAPAYDTDAASDTSHLDLMEQNSGFKTWYHHNTRPHKRDGYRIVTVSLKAPGHAPGDITDTQMELVADLAEQYSFGEIRTTNEQNMILADIKQGDLFTVWQSLNEQGLATANIGTLTNITCCPGLDFCALANAKSLEVAKQLNEMFDDMDYLYDLGEIKLNISGCINACSHHHVAHIGLLGVDKKGEEFYQITLGGSVTREAAIGKIIGKSIPREEVGSAIRKLLEVYTEQRLENEPFLETYRRLGADPFKEKLYGAA